MTKSFSNKSILLITLTTVLSISSNAIALGNANNQLDGGIDLYDDHRFENATTVLNDLVSAREFRRLDSTEKTIAHNYLMYSLLEQDKAKNARRFTKSLLKHAKTGFGKNSEQYVDALFTKTLVQYRAGKSSDAIRTAEQMADILERLGVEYSDDLSHARFHI